MLFAVHTGRVSHNSFKGRGELAFILIAEFFCNFVDGTGCMDQNLSRTLHFLASDKADHRHTVNAPECILQIGIGNTEFQCQLFYGDFSVEILCDIIRYGFYKLHLCAGNQVAVIVTAVGFGIFHPEKQFRHLYPQIIQTLVKINLIQVVKEFPGRI